MLQHEPSCLLQLWTTLFTPWAVGSQTPGHPGPLHGQQAPKALSISVLSRAAAPEALGVLGWLVLAHGWEKLCLLRVHLEKQPVGCVPAVSWLPKFTSACSSSTVSV